MINIAHYCIICRIKIKQSTFISGKPSVDIYRGNCPNEQFAVIHYVLNVFIDIQTSKELIQMDTDKMMTYGTFTMDDEKLTQS